MCCVSGSHLEDLLQLFVVLHHNDIGPAVFGDVLACFSRVGGVDAHSEPTATGEGQVRLQQFLFHISNNRLDNLVCRSLQEERLNLIPRPDLTSFPLPLHCVFFIFQTALSFCLIDFWQSDLYCFH